jgi:penicillin V acylase-like amidase (Ntn superfamily)
MKTPILTLFILLYSMLAFSCTTFVLKNDSTLIFGRNLDWVSDNGVVVVNKRNMYKKSLVFSHEKATFWTSKYGSVTFNQFGKEFPFGGINEKGLVVEIMVVNGEYPVLDDRTAINELQWVQYQLDNAQSIEEVIASDKEIRISAVNQNLHFLICDRFGNVAVIEFDKNGIKVYKDKDLPEPILENEPYVTSLQKSRKNQSCRFGKVSKLLKKYEENSTESAIDYSFKILDNVALDGSWSIVYDIKNMEIQFKTASNKTIRKIKVNDFDFSCNSSTLLYDLQRTDKEYINANFINFSAELNKKKFIDAIQANDIRFPKEVFVLFYEYYDKCSCVEE